MKVLCFIFYENVYCVLCGWVGGFDCDVVGFLFGCVGCYGVGFGVV